jgi:arylsulfatase A-like enzyme
MRRSEVMAGCAVTGCMAGVLAGLFEAALLCFNPRLPGLGAPDVGYLVWIVAPLADLVLLGIFGLIVGCLGAITRAPGRRTVLAPVAVILGGWTAYVVSAFLLYRDLAVDLWSSHNIHRAGWILLAASVAGYVILAVWRSGSPNFFGNSPTVWRSPLAKALWASCGVLLGALVLHIALQFLRPATARAVLGASSRSPNIVLITLDTVRADHLSAYGYSRPTTPVLDRLATQGVLFENAISPTSWTLAAHASLFTGLLPHQHGANWTVPLDDYPQTLAEILGSRGYETAGFTANRYFGQAGWGMAQGFQVYHDDSASLRHNLAVTLVGRAFLEPAYERLASDYYFDRRDAAQLNREIGRWLSHRSGRPYFLFINYFDAHNPYWAPRHYHRLFGETPTYLEDFFRGATQVPRPLSDSERAELVNGYDNCISYLDGEVGKLVQRLRAEPDWPNTIVIITSDHGEGFGEHHTYGHGFDLYRNVLHVPLIILGPEIPRGRRVAEIAPTRQIFATVLDLASGGKLPLQKMSLRRFWNGSPGAAPWSLAISELSPVPQPQNRNAPESVSLFTSEWHFLRNARGKEELYHWPTDLNEEHDLADAAQYEQTREALRDSLFGLTQLSMRPWHGQEYLAAFNGLSPLPRPEALRFLGLLVAPNAKVQRVGVSQAFFNPAGAQAAAGSGAKDPELLRSIPYQ